MRGIHAVSLVLSSLFFGQVALSSSDYIYRCKLVVGEPKADTRVVGEVGYSFSPEYAGNQEVSLEDFSWEGQNYSAGCGLNGTDMTCLLKDQKVEANAHVSIPVGVEYVRLTLSKDSSHVKFLCGILETL